MLSEVPEVGIDTIPAAEAIRLELASVCQRGYSTGSRATLRLTQETTEECLLPKNHKAVRELWSRAPASSLTLVGCNATIGSTLEDNVCGAYSQSRVVAILGNQENQRWGEVTGEGHIGLHRLKTVSQIALVSWNLEALGWKATRLTTQFPGQQSVPVFMLSIHSDLVRVEQG
jgi:hypothetical protein